MWTQNDADPDGGSVTLSRIVSQAGNGTATVVDGARIRFISDSSLNSSSGTVVYEIVDDEGDVAVREAEVSIVRSVPPVAEDDAAQATVSIHYGSSGPSTVYVPTDVHVVANDYDPDGGTVSVGRIVSGPDIGSVEIISDEVIRFTPYDSAGLTEFVYEIVDLAGHKAQATVEVEVWHNVILP